ncbi:uncharacterized protein YbaA (DUF1428 family) [Novosphingobium hassiacum]|uniref:Uncharacterized protein YbaA (DUF1428 family) n=1 Tax=Novosphingobium hassiacum TaxID=173676 RepID=A0A7W5ZYH0_9SPHN|nr:DUF1428 domain-containing protein [Novosphingobium hassiacum]MBB3861433.1 uncharacterized protein YbaA (DUF1428 family) [Novosphingobium hassiacum]
MSYVDGYVIAVPAANREKYEALARSYDAKMIKQGALRVVEAWNDDVPHGKRTDFFRAVEATEGELLIFSWAEWPDKATRDKAQAVLMEEMTQSGEAMDVPFDGARMIFGGFVPFLDLSRPAP